MDTISRQCIVVANGILAHPKTTQQRAARWLKQDPHTLIIAANGGTLNALTLSLIPAIVVGDLDSLSDPLREHLESAGCQFQVSPTRKDQTDLELALHYAIEHHAKQITILGALGGRLDQTMGNILLITLPALNNVEVRIVEGAQTAWLIRNHSTIRGQAGDTLSLIPLNGDAHHVTTEGLEYPLDEATLSYGSSRSISNVLLGEEAAVNVREGTLLAVHTSGTPD